MALETASALELEISKCEHCRVVDTEAQVIPAKYESWPIWSLKNGMTLNFGMGDVPLWSDFLLCPKHAPLAQEKWGGDD